jgi:hypothetical protein
MPLFLKALDPDIDIFGNRQSFHFNNEEMPDDNKGFYSLVNHFTPTAITKLESSLDLLDKDLSGFRLFHEQSLDQTYGSLSLQTYSVFGTSEDIFKYDEVTDKLTFYKDVDFANGGIVTSVAISGSTGLNVTGSPIISSGTINLDLSNNLQSLAGFASDGFMIRSSNGDFLARSLEAGTGITIINSDGINGNPIISSLDIPLTLTGAVTGNGIGNIDTTLGENQSLPFSYLKHNWSSGVEKGVYHILVDDAVPPHFVHKVEAGSGSTYRNWLTVYQPGFGSQPTGRYSIDFYHSINGSQYPFEISISGSTITTYIRANLDMNNNRISNVLDPVSTQDTATKNYVDTQISTIDALSSNEINVNTDGGTNNWLRRANVTRTGTTIYGLSSSTSSFLLENNSVESAGIGVSGSSDACTIWTAGDSGSFLNIQDEDGSNTRVAYVNTSGSWIQVSSRSRKHSIKDKTNNNVLDRFLQLSVKSYGYKYSVPEDVSTKTLSRINKKTNKMQIGLILEELFEVFPNCIPDYYNSLFKDKSSKENLNLKEEIKDISNSGIDYNVLLCYFIMAFQEYINKNNREIDQLKTLLKKENKK